MPRSYRRPYQLANLLRCTTADALKMIRSLGISVSSGNDLIPKSEIRRVLSELALDPLNPRPVQGQGLGDKASSEVYLERTGQGPKGDAASDSNTVREHIDWLKDADPVPELPAVKRELVGHLDSDLSYLKPHEIESIHWYLVEDFARSRDPIDPPGTRDRNLLESAVFRVHTALGPELKYPTIPMAAAAYLHGIIQNHVFFNGNKRTALVATLVFLDLNGQVLEMDQDELFNYVMRISAHEIVEAGSGRADREVMEIARWLHASGRSLSKEDKVLKFHQLRSILKDYGCVFGQPKKGNRINITRGDLKTQIYYRNDGTDVERNTIRKVREDLGLSDDDGYDSTIFYASQERLSAFVNKYRRTLDLLAKE